MRLTVNINSEAPEDAVEYVEKQNWAHVDDDHFWKRILNALQMLRSASSVFIKKTLT